MFLSQGAIFMLHRTAANSGSDIVHNENLNITPDELDQIIRTLKQRRYSFLSLDELAHALRTKQSGRGRFIVFTLDDGYRDNLESGYPVFKAHNIPFCVYVTTSFPERTTNLWWFALESLILQNEVLTLPGGIKLRNSNARDKARNFLKLRELVLEKHFRDPLAFFNDVGSFSYDLEKDRNEKCLSWEHIAELAKDPLATIGCHTLNHLPLSRLPESEVETEIKESQALLCDKLGRSVDHFAFPFGSLAEAGAREYRIARSVGFKTIATAVHGYGSKSADPGCLRRIFLAPSPDDAKLRKRGLYWTIKSLVDAIKPPER